MSEPKILAFAGSTRKGSINQKLLAVAVRGAQEAGGVATILDLADYPLPVFNEDLESESPPKSLSGLRNTFIEHDAFLIASPEYNSSISPLLKNTIDWLSRPAEGQPSCIAFQGKVAGLLAASPGGLGGLRGLVHLRSILQNIGTMVVPQQFALSNAFEAFDDAGELQDEKTREIVRGVSQAVVEVASKLNS